MNPRAEVEASGILSVSVEPRDTGEPDTLKSVPVVPNATDIDELAS